MSHRFKKRNLRNPCLGRNMHVLDVWRKTSAASLLVEQRAHFKVDVLRCSLFAVPYLLFCTVPVWPEFKIMKSVYVHKSLWAKSSAGGDVRRVVALLYRLYFSDPEAMFVSLMQPWVLTQTLHPNGAAKRRKTEAGVNSLFQIDGMHQNKDHFEL